MIPFGLLAGFADQNEIRIIGFAVVKLIYKKDFTCIWKCALCCIPTLVLGLIFLYVL